MSTLQNSNTSDGCKLERFERNHYFNGKLLTARDLADEQVYHVERLSTLARYVLGDGLVCGLTVQVSHSVGEEDVTVELSEGLALDCCGNLVVVKDGTTEDITPPSGVDELHLYLKYRECFRESVPVPNSGDACEEDCDYNRVLEIYELVAEPDPLGDDPSSIGPVSFPRENELAERESAESLDPTDPELLRIAQSYDTAEHATCADCDDPFVYLCALERSDDIWQKVEDSDRSHLVYTNEMLYAALARHTADFRNPHGTSLAVLAGESVPNTTGARIHVEDEATDAEAVTLTSRSEYVELSATPDTKTIELTTPDITDLANQVDGLETDVTNLETEVTTLETEVTDLQTDVAENDADIDRLERYVMDKTLKYKLECFERLAETFDGTIAGDVAAAVVQRTWDGIDGQVYEDPDAFRAFLGETETPHTFDRTGLDVEDFENELIVTLGEHQFTIVRNEYDGDFEEREEGFETELALVELEKLMGDALSGLVESPRETTYEEAVSELEETLAGDATPLDVAIAQDLVCETTEWFEPTTEEGNLTVDLSSEVIAANVEDSITVSGTARGQGDDVRIYLVDPNGEYRTADGDTGAESVSVEDGQFEMEYTAFDETGEYVFLVVGRAAGDYGSEIGFSADEQLPTGLSHEEAIDTVLKAYTEGDVIVDSVLTAESPSLTINDFTTNGSVRQGPLLVTGTSNRENGTTILVEVLNQNGEPVASQESKVRGDSNDWVANFDLSNVLLGQYHLRAADGQISTSRPFRLIRLFPPIDFPTPPIDSPISPIDRPIRPTDIDFERDAGVEVVDGIGPTRSERLLDANITMLSDLLAEDSERLADVADVSVETAKKWRATAWEHLNE